MIKKPKNIKEPGGYYSTFLATKKVKRRESLLRNFQKELFEVNNIAQKINFDNEKFNTVSNNFVINGKSYGYCLIECLNWPIISYELSSDKTKNYKYWDDDVLYEKEGVHFKELTNLERQKLIKKLYIKDKGK